MPQRILVADDDRSIVTVVLGYLEQAGYAGKKSHPMKLNLYLALLMLLGPLL